MYVYIYNWIILLHAWNIVSQLYLQCFWEFTAGPVVKLYIYWEKRRKKIDKLPYQHCFHCIHVFWSVEILKNLSQNFFFGECLFDSCFIGSILFNSQYFGIFFQLSLCYWFLVLIPLCSEKRHSMISVVSKLLKVRFLG